MSSVLILGGGAIGSAVAASLAAQPGWQGSIQVLERDPTYSRASSALSAASIRQQFSTPLNIALSQHGLALLRSLGARAGLVEGGYLYLASAAGSDAMRQLHEVQRAAGADVALLTPAEMQARWPWLATQDLALGSFGRSGEGWFDGWGLLQHLRSEARARGAEYLHGEAEALVRETNGGIAGVQTATGLLQADLYVLACGAWSGALAATAGLQVPVSARRRSVFAFRSPQQAPGCPLVIDPSGLWFRPEALPGDGAGFICGGTPLDDRPGLPLEPEADLFEQHLWPALAERVPGFEAVRPQRAWAGYYEMNDFDHNGLVGALPGCPQLLLACGFSGHGLQHAPGVGRGLAEWIAHGEYRSLDLSPLSPRRLAQGRPIRELNVI